MQTETADIIALFITNKDSETIAKTALSLDTEGVVGDKHYAKGAIRSILVASTESYRMVQERIGVEMPHGYLGENILLDGSIRDLVPGDRLHIGDVVLEITQNCSLCSHLGALDKRIPALLKEDRGIFAKTVRGGRISLDDHVKIEKKR